MKSKRGRSAVVVVAALFVIFSLFPLEAHAYLDPGTGSYILQLALAALVGTVFAIRLFWGRIKAFFARLFSKEQVDEQPED